jgi:hypothetical protein
MSLQTTADRHNIAVSIVIKNVDHRLLRCRIVRSYSDLRTSQVDGTFCPAGSFNQKPHLILGRCTEASLQELSTIGFAFFFPEKSDAEYYVDQIIGYLFSAFDRFCLF